jgi:hypothetical protein
MHSAPHRIQRVNLAEYLRLKASIGEKLRNDEYVSFQFRISDMVGRI